MCVARTIINVFMIGGQGNASINFVSYLGVFTDFSFTPPSPPPPLGGKFINFHILMPLGSGSPKTKKTTQSSTKVISHDGRDKSGKIRENQLPVVCLLYIEIKRTWCETLKNGKIRHYCTVVTSRVCVRARRVV